MSVHGNGKDNRNWVIKTREGRVVEGGFGSYADAVKALREIVKPLWKMLYSATYGSAKPVSFRDVEAGYAVVTE